MNSPHPKKGNVDLKMKEESRRKAHFLEDKQIPSVEGIHKQYLKDKGVIDSGCSRHMTGNKSYLINYEEINGGFVAFGGNSKGGKITGKDFKLTDRVYKVEKALYGLHQAPKAWYETLSEFSLS
ncbi:hypothetical protein Tco_0597345 [Tanacetum coccineum]